MILVLSTGRAGSHYFTWVLREAGYDIGHETLRGHADGACGWPMLLEVQRHKHPTVLHLWRDPVAACSAYSAFTSHRWRQVRRKLRPWGIEVPEEHTLSTFMRWWYEMTWRNREAAVYSWPLEALGSPWVRSRVQEYFARPLDFDAPVDRASRPHPQEYTREDLLACDKVLALEMFALAASGTTSAHSATRWRRRRNTTLRPCGFGARTTRA